MSGLTLRETLPPVGSDPFDVVGAFSDWAAAGGRPLYSHQEEAALSLADGEHVVLATPTGSGKSLVAMVGIALARNRGVRSVWTAPIKALVAEKFFDLVNQFGADEVGLAIGDASINRNASILVCTSEVFANAALSQGDAAGFGFACLDEFHYYGEADRGWAWQAPLLTLKHCQFVLASATLGDMSFIAEDLERRTQRRVASVTSVNRPTPLYHAYRTTPIAESVAQAIEDGLFPVYVVHSTQAAALERAQALVSLPLTSRPQREAIAEALVGEKLTHGFGAVLGRLLRNGVGVHHAGMLPRYRRLVERLAGEGKLPVICGTDTLGVGVNIPIRTVLLSALTKFDGSRVRTLRSREFHQLAGRAGRPGFDPDGHVWAQAPEHVIDNERALAKVGDDPKARRKVKRTEPPKGFVHWDDKTFDRLVASTPEPLVSRFRVTPDLVAGVLGRRDATGPDVLKELLVNNHDAEQKRRAHIRRAIAVYRSLEAAGVAERVRDSAGACVGVRIGGIVESDDGTLSREALSFSSPLGPYAIELVASLDVEGLEPTAYVLEVVSVIEAVLDDPMAILTAQERAARGAEIARLKAEGVPYEERMDSLDTISWPKPMADILEATFTTYREHHPWVEDRPSPKSILREMLETGETFAGFIHRYKLERSEGLLLRYLTDAWRALDRSLPAEAYTDHLEDVIDWLRGMLTATDASLLDEWERLSGRAPVERETRKAPTVASGPPPAWRTTMRTASFGWVELFARGAIGLLADRTGWPVESLEVLLRAYKAEHSAVETGPEARGPKYFSLVEAPNRWVIRQRFVDPEGDQDWGFVASVDLVVAAEDGAPTLVLDALGPFGSETSRPEPLRR